MEKRYWRSWDSAGRAANSESKRAAIFISGSKA
jgi:hypothetical protein